MSIEVNVSGKTKMAYGTEVDVDYICPHCGNAISETICFSSNIKNCVADVPCHECPECGEYNDLDVDLY